MSCTTCDDKVDYTRQFKYKDYPQPYSYDCSVSSVWDAFVQDTQQLMHHYSVWPLFGGGFNSYIRHNWIRAILLVGLILSIVFLSIWPFVFALLFWIGTFALHYYLASNMQLPITLPRSLQHGVYEQFSNENLDQLEGREGSGADSADEHPPHNQEIPVYGLNHIGPKQNYAPYSTGDFETENPLVSEHNPMGNPTTYDFNTAVNMDKPRAVFHPKQEWAELYREQGEIPDGFWLNPIPDPTLMARGVFFPESSEFGRSITQDLGLGYSR